MSGKAHVGPQRRVLIIEDDPDAAHSLADVLQLHGYSVAIAYDGCQGVDIARLFPPDVVLCDLGLARMDGCDVAQAFRSDPLLCSARLVALTGHTSPWIRARALQAGFEQYVLKPADIAGLVQLIAG